MRVFAQLVGTLLLVGFVLTYWWLVALVVAVVLAVKFGPGIYRRYQASAAAERRRVAELAARADEQHRWVLRGDDRGVYGPDGAQLMYYIRSGDQPTRVAYALTAVPQWV